MCVWSLDMVYVWVWSMDIVYIVPGCGQWTWFMCGCGQWTWLRFILYVGVVNGHVLYINTFFRRLMIEKVAVHIADFTPRLQSNTRATYQYCAMPVVQYPQLENELFCNIFYLRHLCDTQKFPDWEIKEPV